MAVAAELSRREYDAAITLGNTPTLDLICSSPGEWAFTVQVKSASAPNWIRIRKSMLEAAPRDDLLFAVVLVPTDEDKAFRYFILTHEEACTYFSKQRRVKRDGTPYVPGHEGLSWGTVKQHEERWDKLPP